jgi:hypothetical protein
MRYSRNSNKISRSVSISSSMASRRSLLLSRGCALPSSCDSPPLLLAVAQTLLSVKTRPYTLLSVCPALVQIIPAAVTPTRLTSILPFNVWEEPSASIFRVLPYTWKHQASKSFPFNKNDFVLCPNQKQTPWPLVRERTIPIERPPLAGEI